MSLTSVELSTRRCPNTQLTLAAFSAIQTPSLPCGRMQLSQHPMWAHSSSRLYGHLHVETLKNLTDADAPRAGEEHFGGQQRWRTQRPPRAVRRPQRRSQLH